MHNAEVNSTSELTPAQKLDAAAQRLGELQKLIDSGNYTVETLLEYDQAYSDYIRADLPRQPLNLLERIKQKMRLS